MNKKIPKSIEPEVRKALSFYPQLYSTPITFKFKKNIKKSTMMAQPTYRSFLKRRRHRAYIILISEKFKISGVKFATKDIPSEVMIGWLGHELGHVLDYERQSNIKLIVFGIKYFLFNNSIRKAERAADTFAVRQGMMKYIIATKNFILNHADITERYKNRIKRYYLSPEEIMEIVEE
ncbi:MAG TPA: hypothetical protein VJ970_02155 [Flavobacteriaceae bacterium]|nr:hypothetical protein [Flavobacteriaceae bacterium]